MSTTFASRITTVPSGGPLAAEVRGVDLRNVSDEDFAAIHRLWIEHLVLLFRGQTLDDDQLLAFSRRFGELDWAPIQETGRRFVEGKPEIYIISNVIENGEPIGSLGAGEATWHTDMSHIPQPPKASVLYALEVPPSGGDTGFVNMYLGYEAMPEALKRRLEGLKIKHDGTYNSGGYVRQGVEAIDDPVRSVGQVHPLVCTHPLAESEALLDEIWSYATRDEYSWYNQWRVGDLVLWDNRCTMHRRDPFDASTRRIMHRTQIKGETAPAA
jgi:taurine dioxygenase